MPTSHLTLSAQHNFRTTAKPVHTAQNSGVPAAPSLVRKGTSWSGSMDPLPYRITMLDLRRPRVTGRPTFKQAFRTRHSGLTALICLLC